RPLPSGPRPLPLRPRGAPYSAITVIAMPPKRRTIKRRLFFQPDGGVHRPSPALPRRGQPFPDTRWPWPGARQRTDPLVAVLGRELLVQRQQSSLDHGPGVPAIPTRARSTTAPFAPQRLLAMGPAARWDADAFPCPCSCCGPSVLRTPEVLPWWDPSQLIIVFVLPPTGARTSWPGHPEVSRLFGNPPVVARQPDLVV